MPALLLALSLSGVAEPQDPPAPPPVVRRDAWVTEQVRGPGLVQHVYASAAAGADVSYHVWLPPGYVDAEPARRYPVLYWLHGSGGGVAGIAPVARWFDTAVREGRLPPLLVVFPNGLADGMWCDSRDGRTPVETVLVREIVPRIDALFATVARREGRLLEGFSMGGYGALRLAFVHRDLFAAASSLGGGPLQRELVATPRANEARRLQVLHRVYGGDQAVFRQQSPWQLASEHADALRGATRIRLLVGDRDETLPANRDLHAHFERLGLPHAYEEVAGVPHDALRLLRQLGDRFFAFHREVLAGVGG